MSFTVELDEETAAVVKELAAAESRSASEVIRDAVAAYPGIRKRRLPKDVGKYSSDHTETAQHVDEILRDAVKEGQWPYADLTIECLGLDECDKRVHHFPL